MQQYDTFIFDSYAFDADTGVVTLCYALDDDVVFEERIAFPKDSSLTADRYRLHEALFGLHLICGISYYKTCLPKKIEIRSGSLNEQQAEYWNTVYTKGLGEFFYQNDIDFRNLIRFPTHKNESGQTSREPLRATQSERTLVPFGGGKDSFVTAEILKKQGEDITLLRVNAHPLIEQAIAATGLPSITVERTLSPALFALNKEGALNGHVPATAIVSWIAVVAAVLYDFGAIMMSNEKSASAGNAVLHGMDVNHQWSKGEEFERMTADYIEKWVVPKLLYVSALRDFTELQIAQTFAMFPEYLPLAVSCNRNWKIEKGEGRREKAEDSAMKSSSEERTNGGAMKSPGEARRTSWCGTCPKCAFVFALYAAFLPKETVTKIFGKNLYADEALLPLYKELLGVAGTKPFECVGTPEETRDAFALARRRGEWDGDAAMKMFLKTGSSS